ncbi:MAG TPA: cytochrome b/b6 domain-containing protein [Thermoleophilia bacterium]|nr:cytochrome b/b6 domain-containing protein [Thermoleophilia bacterium]
MSQSQGAHEGVNLVYHRFSAFHRFNHYLVIVSFFGLTLTGIPLKFKDSYWSQLIMDAVGGVAAAGFIHRVMAVANILYFVLEVGYMALYVVTRKGPVFHDDSIVPGKKDWADMKGMFRWFLGKGSKPRLSRFTYWEKFDFWALFAGTFLIGGSGLMMWFPEATTRILPGVALNVALVIHSNEAFLAVGVIFIFVHFFSAHGRPESFPADQVIFSGYLPVEHYIHDRPEEYSNRLKSGTLQEVVGPLPAAGRRRLFRVVTTVVTIFGFLAASYTLLLVLWPLAF